MPITGHLTYVQTIDAFIAHWINVDLTLGAAGPLVLANGMTVANLLAHRDGLESWATAMQGKLNDVEIARGEIELQRAALSKRLNEFNRKVRGFLSHTVYVRALPEIPSPGAALAAWLAALDEMVTLWVKIDAATIPGFTGPLSLRDGYLIAAFETDLAALKAAVTILQKAKQDLKLCREGRKDLEDVVRPILRDYRQAVQGTFDPDHALVASLPRLTPARRSTRKVRRESPDPAAMPS